MESVEYPSPLLEAEVSATGSASPITVEERRAANIASIEAAQRHIAAEKFRNSANRDFKFRGEVLEKELQNSHPLAAIIRKAEVKEEKAQRDAQRQEQQREQQTLAINAMIADTSRAVWKLSALQAAEDAERRLIEREEAKAFSGGYYKSKEVPDRSGASLSGQLQQINGSPRGGRDVGLTGEISRFNDPDLLLGIDHDDHPFRVLSAVSSLPAASDHLSSVCPPNTILGRLQRLEQSTGRNESLQAQRQVLAKTIDDYVQRKAEGDAKGKLTASPPQGKHFAASPADGLLSSFLSAGSASANMPMSWLLESDSLHPYNNGDSKETAKLGGDFAHKAEKSALGASAFSVRSASPPADIHERLKGLQMDISELCSIRKPPLVGLATTKGQQQDGMNTRAVVQDSKFGPTTSTAAASPSGAAASILSAYTPFVIGDDSFLAKRGHNSNNNPKHNQSVLTFGDASLLRSEGAASGSLSLASNNGPADQPKELPYTVEHGGITYQCRPTPTPLDPRRLAEGANKTNASGIDVKSGMQAAYDELAREMMRAEDSRRGMSGSSRYGSKTLDTSGGSSSGRGTIAPSRNIPSTSNLPIRRTNSFSAKTNANTSGLHQRNVPASLNRFTTDTVRGLIGNHGVPPLAPTNGTSFGGEQRTPTEAKSRLTSAPAAFVGRMRPSAFDSLHANNNLQSSGSLSLGASARELALKRQGKGSVSVSEDQHRPPAERPRPASVAEIGIRSALSSKENSYMSNSRLLQPNAHPSVVVSDPKPIPTAALFSSPTYKPSAETTMAALASTALKAPAQSPTADVPTGKSARGGRSVTDSWATEGINGADPKATQPPLPLSVAMLGAARLASPPSATMRLMLNYAGSKQVPATQTKVPLVGGKRSDIIATRYSAGGAKMPPQNSSSTERDTVYSTNIVSRPTVQQTDARTGRNEGDEKVTDLVRSTMDAELRRARLLSGNRVRPVAGPK